MLWGSFPVGELGQCSVLKETLAHTTPPSQELLDKCHGRPCQCFPSLDHQVAVSTLDSSQTGLGI